MEQARIETKETLEDGGLLALKITLNEPETC